MKRLNRSIALIVMLAAVAAMGAVAGAEEPHIGKLPSGWIERKPLDESIERYFIYQEKATVLAELMIFEEELPAEIPTRDYLEAVKENGMPNFANYTPIEDEAAILNGRDVMIHRFYFSNQQDLLRGEAYVFVFDTTGYLLLFDTTDGWFTRVQPKFEQFIKEAVYVPAPPKPEKAPEPEKKAEPETKTEPETQTPKADPADEPAKPAEDRGEELPAFDDDEEDEKGGLPQFEDDEVKGFFSAAGWEIFIALPEGAEEVARSDEGVEVSGPDGSNFTISLFEDFETAKQEAEKGNEALRKHSTSSIKCGENAVEVEVTLYSGEQDGIKLAVLAAHWENTGGTARISLPRENYSAAGDWIKEMLCSVKLSKK